MKLSNEFYKVFSSLMIGFNLGAFMFNGVTWRGVLALIVGIILLWMCFHLDAHDPNYYEEVEDLEEDA